jgi:hypothetical protein
MNITNHPNLFGRGSIRVCRRGKSILLVALSRLDRFNAFNDDGACYCQCPSVHRDTVTALTQ